MFSFLLRFKYLDWVLLFSVLGISSFGMTALYSIGLGKDVPSFSYLQHQGVVALIGFVTIFVFSLFNYRILKNTSVIFYIFTCLLLLAVLFFGDKIRGTRGWFLIGGAGFQPAELAKIALILILAKYFSSWTRQVGQLRHIFQSACLMVVPTALILLQPDFGSAVILFAIWFVMILMSGIPKKYIIALGGIMVIFFSCAWFFLFQDYQKDRIISFLFPAADVRGAGYNVRQAMIAVGAGQLTGTGIGSGSQSHLKFLPETQTDFIFSVIAEEFGFVGVTFLFLFWLMLIYRLNVLLRASADDFAAYTLLGITTMLFTQFIINIGGNLGLLPVTGLVLPFVSYGGSALLISLMCIGIVQSIWSSRMEYS